ncbi:hypothetical protein [Antarcticimicrobium sediminis]|uniref:Uncharacterized protein n=1 Tax=Antarcticimicrobium sediminis TaxID=2546227 RepID=A0A4R5EXS5_9RHOB|nr:hypothetical protein [Antarcticimicrobium sediminis]TDE39835.1 hypothetical protein E1B25_07250 [Antarcticimicrobium sediminis]
MKDSAVESNTISLRRTVRDWRDWWEIETELFLTMASKALILDLSDIHESHSTIRALFYGSNYKDRIEAALDDWAEYVTRHLPGAARMELSFLLRHEHLPEPITQDIHTKGFSWVDTPTFSRLREEALKGGSELREIVRVAVLGEDSDGEGQSLRAAVLDHLKTLEAIAMEKE